MSEMILSFDFLNKGGWVAWVLALLSGLMWYGIGYRYLFLSQKDLLSRFTERLRTEKKGPNQDLETFFQFQLRDFWQQVGRHQQMIKALVMVAPLLGLLGTVIGMIETFDSLADAALFSQSGGVAGGISQALITTQMGLVVAIPGLLIGKKLDRKQEYLSDKAEEVIQSILLQGDRV